MTVDTYRRCIFSLLCPPVVYLSLRWFKYDFLITRCRGQSWDAVHKDQVGYKYVFVVNRTTLILWVNTSENRLFRLFFGAKRRKVPNITLILSRLRSYPSADLELFRSTNGYQIPESYRFRDFSIKMHRRHPAGATIGFFRESCDYPIIPEQQTQERYRT